MALTLEMPLEEFSAPNANRIASSPATPTPDSQAAEQAADLLDMAEAVDVLSPGEAAMQEAIAFHSDSDAPPTDQPVVAETAAESNGQPAKPKQGRKKKGEQVAGQPLLAADQPAGTEGTICPSSVAPVESSDARPADSVAAATPEKTSRAQRIVTLTAELVEVVLQCQEHESAIDHHKAELKRLDAERSELSIELRGLRESEQWQPPLFDPPRIETTPMGMDLSEDEPAAVEQSSQPVDPDAWKTAPLADLGLPPKLAEKLADAEIATVGDLKQWIDEKQWPKGIGKAKAEIIIDAFSGWLSNWQACNLIPKAEVGQGVVSEAAAPASPAATPSFANWESMTDAKQREFITARAAELNDRSPNCLAPKHPSGSGFWDSGRAAHGSGDPLAECGYIPGPEQDDWLRGWLAGAATENYPDAETAEQPEATAKAATTQAATTQADSLDDLLGE